MLGAQCGVAKVGRAPTAEAACSLSQKLQEAAAGHGGCLEDSVGFSGEIGWKLDPEAIPLSLLLTNIRDWQILKLTPDCVSDPGDYTRYKCLDFTGSVQWDKDIGTCML